MQCAEGVCVDSSNTYSCTQIQSWMPSLRSKVGKLPHIASNSQLNALQFAVIVFIHVHVHVHVVHISHKRSGGGGGGGGKGKGVGRLKSTYCHWMSIYFKAGNFQRKFSSFLKLSANIFFAKFCFMVTPIYNKIHWTKKWNFGSCNAAWNFVLHDREERIFPKHGVVNILSPPCRAVCRFHAALHDPKFHFWSSERGIPRKVNLCVLPIPGTFPSIQYILRLHQAKPKSTP